MFLPVLLLIVALIALNLTKSEAKTVVELVPGEGSSGYWLVYDNGQVANFGTASPVEAVDIISIYCNYFLQIGCNAVSWGPYLQAGSVSGQTQSPVKRFVSGGCDNLVKIWRFGCSKFKYSTHLLMFDFSM